jgi:predicted DNA-binding transcriptional regulator AlpA
MTMENVRREQHRDGEDVPIQLSLRLGKASASRNTPSVDSSRAEGINDLDRRMSTADVLRIVGVHRATLFRWTRKGIFPAKHVSGGWIRSDIERWLACRASPQPLSLVRPSRKGMSREAGAQSSSR